MSDDCRASISIGMEALVDKAVVQGADHKDMFTVLNDELVRLRLALEQDPDPAEDGAPMRPQEPDNVWSNAKI